MAAALEAQRCGDAEGARAPGEVVLLGSRWTRRIESIRLRLCVVDDRVCVEEVVAKRRDVPAGELQPGPTGEEAGGGQRVREPVFVLAGVVRILHGREPWIAARILPIETCIGRQIGHMEVV